MKLYIFGNPRVLAGLSYHFDICMTYCYWTRSVLWICIKTWKSGTSLFFCNNCLASAVALFSPLCYPTLLSTLYSTLSLYHFNWDLIFPSMSFPHFPDFPHGRPYAILALSHGCASKASVVIEFCPRPAAGVLLPCPTPNPLQHLGWLLVLE